MSEHRATVQWQLEGEFKYETYSRSHSLEFEGGTRVAGGAAPENIPETAHGSRGIDPEQMLIAAVSSCHMLWFLHLACTAKHVVERYRDEVSGVLAKNAEGKEAITRVTLRPVVSFRGTPPTAEQFERLHERAHERCYVANSVRSEVVLEPRIG